MGISDNVKQQINNVVEHYNELVKSKSKGKAWVKVVAPLLFVIASTGKMLAAEKEDEIRLTKTKLDIESKPFNDQIKVIGKMDKELRQRFLKEYGEKESLVIPGHGEIIIKQPWGFTVIDESAIPDDLWCVDMEKIADEVKNGVREIPGVNVFQDRTITVMPEKKAVEE
jgi:hypothetical protein